MTGPDCALHVRVSHKGHPHDEVIEEVCFRPHCWEFFAFSLSCASTRDTGDLSVMLNGELKWKRPFLFPRFTVLSHVAIGYSAGTSNTVTTTSSMLETRDTQEPSYRNQLNAQVNALHLFASSLNDVELRRMFEFGLDCMGTSGLLFAGCPLLVAKLLLCLSPSLTSQNGNLFLNTCRRKTGSWADAFGVVARRMPGTHASIRWNTHDVLDCIGGILVLFPLFAQLLLKNPHTGDDTINTDLCTSILDLMADLLHGHKGKFNRRLMERYNGFHVIGYVLRRINAAYLTIDCVQSIEDLFLALDDAPRLQQDAIRFLYADFHLWSRANLEVQLSVAKALKQLACSSLSASSSHIPATQKGRNVSESNTGGSLETKRVNGDGEVATENAWASILRSRELSTLRAGVLLMVQVRFCECMHLHGKIYSAYYRNGILS